MSGALRLTTLGEFSLTFDGRTLATPLSRKGRALVVYLAVTGHACRREFLSELLWPGRSQSQSLGNLRKLLTELRDEIGPWVSITRESVGLNPGTYWLDAAELSRCLALADAHPGDGKSNHSVQALETALAYYRGEFLDGLDIESDEFDAWVILERERLRYSIMQVLDRLVEARMLVGDVQNAIDHGTRLLQLDPLREKTYAQLMRILARAGQREVAMRHYEQCCRALDEELGIAPGPELMDLYEQIRQGQFVAVESRPPLPDQRSPQINLPVQATSFVGREDDLQAVLGQLANPDCRLLTIGGPGGIGKTRLAIEAARRAVTLFADGVCFVPLFADKAADAMVLTVIRALGIQWTDAGPDPRATLLAWLADREVLLVLDNMEQLVGDLSLLVAILTSAPKVSLLATSRQPLALEWEWYFALDGMDVPESASTTPEACSSVQLFVERARRVQHAFKLSNDPAGVVAICRLVEGMPLGIELAASWVSVASCSEIAAQLLSLNTPFHGAESRHYSLRALFEQTWDRLSDREQMVLMQLSVFRGGFTSAAAAAVLDAQLTDLALLVHKSLISLNFHTNRYDMHQLLLQFLREKLAAQPEVETQSLNAHCSYYMVLVQSDGTGHGPGDLRPEINNLRAAWAYAVRQRQFDQIERFCTDLNAFFTLNVMHHEALATFRAALTALETEPESEGRDRVELALQSCLIAPLTAVYGWEDRALWPVAERIRDLAERLGNHRQVLASLILLVDLYACEQWERALEVGREAVEFSQQHLGHQEQMAAHILNELPYLFMGRLSESLEHARAAQALFDPNDCLWATTTYGIDPMVISLSHAGMAQVMLGHADQGDAALDAAAARARALEQPLALCFALAFDALSHLVTRENVRSMADSEAIIALAEEHGFAHWRVFGPCFRAISLIQQGEYQAGIDALLPALELEAQAGLTHNLPSWYAHLGLAYAHIGQPDLAFGALDLAIAEAERIGERYHESLVYRLQGKVRLFAGNETGAEASYRHAIEIAKRQQSRFYELQALLDLYDLRCMHGADHDARERLRELAVGFTEGRDRPDLHEARLRLHS